MNKKEITEKRNKLCVRKPKWELHVKPSVKVED